MTPLAWLITFAALGVDTGYEPASDGQLEYIMQIEPQLLDRLKAGYDLTSVIPAGLDARHYRVTVGTAKLPRVRLKGDAQQSSATTANRPPDETGEATNAARAGYQQLDSGDGEYVLELSPEGLSDLNTSDLAGDLPKPTTRIRISTKPGAAPATPTVATQPPATPPLAGDPTASTPPAISPAALENTADSDAPPYVPPTIEPAQGTVPAAGSLGDSFPSAKSAITGETAASADAPAGDPREQPPAKLAQYTEQQPTPAIPQLGQGADDELAPLNAEQQAEVEDLEHIDSSAQPQVPLRSRPNSSNLNSGSSTTYNPPRGNGTGMQGTTPARLDTGSQQYPSRNRPDAGENGGTQWQEQRTPTGSGNTRLAGGGGAPGGKTKSPSTWKEKIEGEIEQGEAGVRDLSREIKDAEKSGEGPLIWLITMLLCFSLGANGYLAWITWDARIRARMLLEQLHDAELTPT